MVIPLTRPCVTATPQVKARLDTMWSITPKRILYRLRGSSRS
jgi:hypothetical protein